MTLPKRPPGAKTRAELMAEREELRGPIKIQGYTLGTVPAGKHVLKEKTTWPQWGGDRLSGYTHTWERPQEFHHGQNPQWYIDFGISVNAQRVQPGRYSKNGIDYEIREVGRQTEPVLDDWGNKLGEEVVRRDLQARIARKESYWEWTDPYKSVRERLVAAEQGKAGQVKAIDRQLHGPLWGSGSEKDRWNVGASRRGTIMTTGTGITSGAPVLLGGGRRRL